MNAPHLHLMLNHLPVMGLPLVAIILAWGLLRRSRDLLRVGLGLTVVLAAATYPVTLTGNQAEDAIEGTTWALEPLVEQHEERAKTALIVVLVTGALAAIALWYVRGEGPVKPVPPSIVLGAVLVSSTMLGLAALDGGKIRHDEIRGGPPPITETQDQDEGGTAEREH